MKSTQLFLYYKNNVCFSLIVIIRQKIIRTYKEGKLTFFIKVSSSLKNYCYYSL